MPRKPRLRPLMRRVSGTERKPTSVLSETAHRTEWMITKTSEGVPSPNQISASGRSAIAGSGLNIAVSVVSSPEPRRGGQSRDRRQGVKHPGERLHHPGAEAGRARARGEDRREREPGAVAVGER